MKLASLLEPSLILCGLKADGYESAKDLMLSQLVAFAEADKDSIHVALTERESLGTTVIAPGIAFPHARVDQLKDFYILVATFPDGFAVSDQTEPVRLVVMFLMPEGASNLYLRSVSAFSKLIAGGGLDGLLTASTPDALIEHVENVGVAVKDIVTTSDIMQRDPPSIQADETVAAAADLLVKHNIPVLPVVDSFGEYIGAVTAEGLLKVGLPDYLLSMGSVEVLSDFEPFKDLLKQEQSLRVEEILDREIPVLEKDAPMIQAAGKLVQQSVHCAVVVHEKKLVGLISCLDFVHKVVRA